MNQMRSRYRIISSINDKKLPCIKFRFLSRMPSRALSMFASISLTNYNLLPPNLIVETSRLAATSARAKRENPAANLKFVIHFVENNRLVGLVARPNLSQKKLYYQKYYCHERVQKKICFCCTSSLFS